MAVLTYPEYWTDRIVTIEGGIKLAPPPDKDDFGKRLPQGFYIRDASGSIFVIAPEGKQTEYLRNQIIYNDGDDLEGIFSFALDSDTYKSLGMIGVLKSFSLKK